MTRVVSTQEEDSKSLMDRERRKEAIKAKLHRLDGCIARTKRDQEGQCSSLAVEKRKSIKKENCFLEGRNSLCDGVLLIQGCLFFKKTK